VTLALSHGHAAVAFASTLHATAGWWNATRVLAVANVVLAAVGVGTVIFGLFAIKSSATLAVAAGKQAAASDRIAVSADMQNLAGVRPLLVEVPKGLLGAAEIDQEGPGKILWGKAAEGTIVLTVPLRNIGPGAAFVDRVTIGPMNSPIAEAEMTSRAIAPGDVAFIVSLAQLGSDATRNYEPLIRALEDGVVTAEVTYADVNRTQRTLTRLTVAKAGNTTLVKIIELYHCDETWRPIEPPFVRTRLPAGPQAPEPPAEEQEPLPGMTPRVLSDEERVRAVRSAHTEGFGFGEAVARDAPSPWLDAVLARKPRMPSGLEARLLQGSALPSDSLLNDEVRQALRRGFWDSLERGRPPGSAPGDPAAT
jgi:hypothetical protein